MTICITGIESTGTVSASLRKIEIMGICLSTDIFNIIVFRQEADLCADMGVTVDELALPDEVTALLANGRRQNVGVIWNCDDYDAGTAGTYTFIGTVKKKLGLVVHTNNLTVQKKVILESLAEETRNEILFNDGCFFKGSWVDTHKIDYNDSAFETVSIAHTWNAEDG